MERSYKLETYYFYSLFFIHLLTYRFAFIASAYVGISALYLLLNPEVKHKLKNYVAILLVLTITSAALFVGAHFREIAFLLWFMLLYLSFIKLKFPLKLMLKFLNVTFLFYLFLSFLVSFYIINGGFRAESVNLNQFTVSYFNFSWITLVGFAGTTAAIDAYAMLIFIVNLLYSSKFRWWMVAISLGAIVMTTRMTPWVMIIIAVGYMLFRKSRPMAYLFSLGLFVSFMIPHIFLDVPELQAIFFAISHGRSWIWNLYYDIFFQSDLTTILLGIRESKIPDVYLGNWIGYINAPHSSYFRILITNGLLIYLVFYFVITKIIIASGRFGRKPIFVVVAILVAAITNENIFHNHNPIYLLTMLYFSVGENRGNQEELK